MNIIFTLCSINYLGQAKTLFDSVQKSNPSWSFILGIVDKNVNQVDLSFLQCSTLEVDKVRIDGFEEMVAKYNIVELITAVKPFYFTHFFETFPQAKNIIYLDPDIMLLGSLEDLEQKLDVNDIILTPHLTTPITDTFQPTEKHLFNTGVFNLGFLAVNRSENTSSMLTWWGNKLRTECILDLTRGLFVDQLWMNLVPAYFNNVLIDKSPGYNMAHWNLHERKITGAQGSYKVNGQDLIFYHFSHYRPGKPKEIAAFHTRYTFETRPDLVELYETYRCQLLKNRYFELKSNPCFYMQNERKKRFKRDFETFFRNNLPLSVKMKLRSALTALNFVQT